MNTNSNTLPIQPVADILQCARQLATDKEWVRLEQLLQNNAAQVKYEATAHFFMGLIAFHRNHPKKARIHFSGALQINPEHVDTLYYFGSLCVEENNPFEAIPLLRKAIELYDTHYDAKMRLALCLRNTGRFDDAIDIYKSIEKDNPDHPRLANHLAIAYDMVGEKEHASEYFEKALAQAPDDTSIMYDLTFRKAYAPESDLANALRTQYESLKQDTPTDQLINACYGLANIYEKNGTHQKAFEYYSEANGLQSSLYPSSLEGEGRWVDILKSTFTPDFFEQCQHTGCEDNAPVFIVGMPRSGTTLVEQILSSHPQVYGAGELQYLHKIFAFEIPKLTQKTYPLGLEKLQTADYKTLGEEYIRDIRTYSDKPHVTDKMPHNYFHVPLIKLILPNAKIIHCMRDPMDTCWSIWRKSYIGRHTYKSNFNDLAKAYTLQQDIMAYWKSLFPGSIYDNNYEALVEEPESHIRKLLEYCELEWDEACLDFHKNKRSVATASLHQVSQPIYKSSLNSWEPVKNQLKPLQEALEKYGAYSTQLNG